MRAGWRVLGVAVAVTVLTATWAGTGSSATGSSSGADAAPASVLAPDALPSEGCGTSSIVPGEVNVTTRSGGVDRTYIRYVPPAHDGETPLPLIVDIHGFAQGADLQKQNSDWAPRADANGFIAVYPQGIDSLWNPALDGPDIAYIGHLLDEVEAQLCIDTNRIYVTGFSLGALMTSQIACVYSDRVAAVAPVALARYPVEQLACAAARPVPFLTIHGTADNWVSYAPIPGNVAAWAERNGCGSPPAVESVPGDDVVTIERISYPCPPDLEAIFYSIENGGHAWPGSEFSRAIEGAVGYTTFAIDASDVIWDFLAPHRVEPGIVAYTARFNASQYASLEAIASARGETVEELVRVGVQALQYVAALGLATTPPPLPNTGPDWVTVSWPESEVDAIDAAAAAWGTDGAGLHDTGGLLVLAIVYAAGVG